MQTDIVNCHVEKSNVFHEIKKCLKFSKGFYMKRLDGSIVEIKYRKNSDPLDPLTVKILEAASNICPCPLPEDLPHIYDGLRVYYTAFSEEDSDFISHKGRISSIKEEQGKRTFTIDGTNVKNYPGTPVFTYDKSNNTLYLIGVIIPEGKAVHIHSLPDASEKDEIGDERGKTKTTYSIGGFVLHEEGKAGAGPRYVSFTGNTIGKPRYELSFNVDSKRLNPHGDRNYNQGEQPKLYARALAEFAKAYKDNSNTVPEVFHFKFSKTEYTATKVVI